MKFNAYVSLHSILLIRNVFVFLPHLCHYCLASTPPTTVVNANDSTANKITSLKRDLELCMSGKESLYNEVAKTKQSLSSFEKREIDTKIVLEDCLKDVDNLKSNMVSLDEELLTSRKDSAQLILCKDELLTCEMTTEKCTLAKEEEKSGFEYMLSSFKEDCQLRIDDEVTKAHEESKRCKVALFDKESMYNETLTLLKDQDSLKAKFDKRLKSLLSEKAHLNKEIEKLNHNLELSRKKYDDTRIEMSNLDKDLRTMHSKATRTYVNTTLVKHDLSVFVARRADRLFKNTSTTLSRSRRHKSFISFMRKSQKQFYDYFKNKVSPRLPPKVLSYSHKYIEAIRLSLISILEQSSDAVLVYLQNDGIDDYITYNIGNFFKFLKQDSDFVIYFLFVTLATLRCVYVLTRFIIRRMMKSNK